MTVKLPSNFGEARHSFGNRHVLTGCNSFLTIGYFQCIVPFRITRDEENRLRLYTSPIQKVLVFLVMLVNIFVRLYELGKLYDGAPSNIKEWSPPVYFNILHGYTNIVFHCTLWKSVWRSQAVLTWFEHVDHSQCNNLTVLSSNLTAVMFLLTPWILGVAITFLSLLFPVYGIGMPVEHPSWNLTIWFQYSIKTGRELFTLGIQPTAIEDFSGTPYETAFGLLTAFVIYLRYTAGLFEEVFIFMIVLPTWKIAHNFAQSLPAFKTSDDLVSWKATKWSYINIKRLIALVNDIIGPNVFLHTFLSLFYYSFSFDLFMANTDTCQRVKLLFYAGVASVFYYFGADINYQMSTMEDWLSNVILEQNKLCIPSNELAVLLHDLQKNRLSLSCGKYALTHGMLASICGVMMTYFIICVQFRNDPHTTTLERT